MFREALIHGAGRVASAAMSFVLFALVARELTPEGAKTTWFMAFCLGFVVVALRTLTSLAGRLNECHSAPQKVRRIVITVRLLLPVQVIGAVALFVLLRTHPIPRWAVVAGSIVPLLASYDSDTIRAALHKPPMFSVWFAGGSAASVALLAVGPKTVGIACAAIFCQWLPVSALNLYYYARLFAGRGRALWTGGGRREGVWAALLLALFDGIVFNAPFWVGNRLGARTGIELAVVTRVFVSSIPLHPLLLHWSNSKRLARASHRLGFPEPVVFGALLFISGCAAQSLLIALFSLVSGTRVHLGQGVSAVLLLLAFSIYAPAARFARADQLGRGEAVLAASLLVGYYVVFLRVAGSAAQNAHAVIGLQCAVLGAAAVLLVLHGRAHGREVRVAPPGMA